jgi:hypothetical protein
MKLSRGQTMLVRLCAIASLVTLTACANLTNLRGGINIGADTTRTACKSFAAIRWHQKDTTLTLAQIREHNAAYKALCQQAKK